MQGEELRPTQASRRAIEALESSTPPVERKFAWTLPNGESREVSFIQDVLGMFPTQEFITRITEVLDLFVQGDMGMKLGELFRGEIAMPDTFDPESVNDVVDENLEIIKAFIKLVQLMPDLQLDIMCMSLGIPRQQRSWAKDQLQEPPSRGGLTVEEGFDILICFVRQNGSLLRETLVGKAKELADVFRLHVLDQGMEDKGETSSSSSSTISEMEDSTTSLSGSPGGTPSSISFQPTPENG
jgi:hypothetical protein